MAMSTMGSPAARIGKMKGEILAHAVPREVLNLVGETRPMPKNSSDTVVYRRWLPINATTTNPNFLFAAASADGEDRGQTQVLNTYLASEGTTPNAETLVPQDITVTLNEYSVLFGYTKRVADLYEDDVPAAMKEQTGERIALIREMVKFGVAKGCTNKFYGGTGTTRATVNGKLTIRLLRKVARSLDANRAEKITKVMGGSANYATRPVEAAYFVFVHTDLEADVRDLTKFTPVAEYGTMKPVSPYEIGAVEKFRIIASPELVSILEGATSVTATDHGLLSTLHSDLSSTGTYPDVYQVIVAGKDAWGDVALRGASAFDVHDIPPNKLDKSDPTGQRGYIGASTYYAAVLLNSKHMAVIECGASALTD